MPKYRNISSENLVFNSILFRPLEEKEVNFYVTDDKLKLTDENPIWSPVAWSFQGSGTIDILSNLEPTVTLLRIISKTETALVSFNDSSSPKALITNAEPLNIRPVGRIKQVIVHEGTVSAELWNEFAWRG